MDLASLKEQLSRARRVSVPSDGATFQLEVPPEHAWRVIVEEHTDEEGLVRHARTLRALLDIALIGWDGVTTTHLMVDASGEPLPFSDEARAMLLDARQDIADELTIALGAKRKERAEQREAARKN